MGVDRLAFSLTNSNKKVRKINVLQEKTLILTLVKTLHVSGFSCPDEKHI